MLEHAKVTDASGNSIDLASLNLPPADEDVPEAIDELDEFDSAE